MALMLILLREKLIVVFAAAGVLSACSGLGGTFAVDRFLYKDVSGDTFGACMARSYQAWARHKAWVQVNYAGAAELAARGESTQAGSSAMAFVCDRPTGAGVQERVSRYMDIATKDPARACSCGSALVELARLSCAGPAEDKAALQRRLDTHAPACEGR
jgi:hypothetical protein